MRPYLNMADKTAKRANLVNNIITNQDVAPRFTLLNVPSFPWRDKVRPPNHLVIDNGEVIEDYPEDVRGHSCLVLGCGEDLKCIYCKGEMVRKTAPFHIDRKGYHLLFDAIPAWVCGQCGEAYFEEAEVDAIQEVLRKIDKETEKLVAAN